jgi:hypothetical protein
MTPGPPPMKVKLTFSSSSAGEIESPQPTYHSSSLRCADQSSSNGGGSAVLRAV